MASVLLTAAGKVRLRNGKAALVVAGAPVVTPALAALNTAMIGQSNMVHLSDEFNDCLYYATGPLSRRWASGAFARIGWHDPAGHVAPGTPYSVWGVGPYASGMVRNPRGGDGIATFVNEVNAATNTQLTTYEYAVSGSSIQQWQTGGGCWNDYSAAVAASGLTINSSIYLQGEDNANQTTTKAEYKTYLRNLHNQQLALSGMAAADFYFGVAILGPGTTYAPEGRMGIIRAAQLEYIAENVGAYMAGVATDANLAGDSIHFDNPSERRMGGRYAKSLVAWAKGTPAKWLGPKIAGATSSNGGLTVTVATTGGVGALKDGAGGNGASLLGFRFFKADGAQINSTASAISGGNVVFTLASAGVATMDYAMANAPFGGTTAPASVLYDSDTVAGDTIGLPLIPCAAITVT